jgi:hypothetical protein
VNKKSVVCLTDHERHSLRRLTPTGKVSALKLSRTRIRLSAELASGSAA